MDRLHLMSVFVAVAEAESFAGGARNLGMSAPAVTRAIAALEARLGVRLLARTTRVVRLTEAGARYLEDCRRIIADADEADESARGLNAAPRGRLHVTAPVLFGRLFVMPAVQAYVDRYPDVSVNALFLDRVVSLVDEGLDVAVRIGELPDSSLRAIRVGQIRRVVCGAPAYLERHGTPLHPSELQQHRIIATSAITPSTEWRFFRDSRATSVRVSPRLTVNSNDAAIAAAVSGWGLTRVLSYMIAPQLQAGQLQTILTAFEPAPLPIHILHREGRHASAKVRAFIDLIVAHLRSHPGLN